MNNSSSLLSAATIGQLRTVVSRHPHVERVVVFGSRARGDGQVNSDIDLAFEGAELSASDMADIDYHIDMLLLPYRCDTLRMATVTNQDLIDNIQREGIEIFRR